MRTLGILLDRNRRLAFSNRFLCVSRLDRLTFCSMKACYELLIFKVCSMTAVRMPHLSRPGVLASISPKRSFALCQPYVGFSANRSVPIKLANELAS
jgi:hypothetical protein